MALSDGAGQAYALGRGLQRNSREQSGAVRDLVFSLHPPERHRRRRSAPGGLPPLAAEEDLIREACRRMRPSRRRLTLEEWKTYVPGGAFFRALPAAALSGEARNEKRGAPSGTPPHPDRDHPPRPRWHRGGRPHRRDGATKASTLSQLRHPTRAALLSTARETRFKLRDKLQMSRRIARGIGKVHPLG